MASSSITSWQIERGKVEAVTDFLFLGFKITADSDCSHKTKRHMLLGRKAITNLDSILKFRDITLSTKVRISSVQSLSHILLFAIPWTAAHQASWSITNSRSLLKFMSIESVMPSNHLILCRPLLLLPSIFSRIRIFSNESVLHIRWPKDWSFSFSISPFNEYLELISFRMDWLDLLAVQGILKSLPQHLSSKASILWCSAFFMVQFSHPYMTTGKTIVLTRQIFVGKDLPALCFLMCCLGWS